MDIVIQISVKKCNRYFENVFNQLQIYFLFILIKILFLSYFSTLKRNRKIYEDTCYSNTYFFGS